MNSSQYINFDTEIFPTLKINDELDIETGDRFHRIMCLKEKTCIYDDGQILLTLFKFSLSMENSYSNVFV